MTIAMMIFSYSISLGIAWGFITYVIATIATEKSEKLAGQRGYFLLSL